MKHQSCRSHASNSAHEYVVERILPLLHRHSAPYRVNCVHELHMTCLCMPLRLSTSVRLRQHPVCVRACKWLSIGKLRPSLTVVCLSSVLDIWTTCLLPYSLRSLALLRSQYLRALLSTATAAIPSERTVSFTIPSFLGCFLDRCLDLLGAMNVSRHPDARQPMFSAHICFLRAFLLECETVSDG